MTTASQSRLAMRLLKRHPVAGGLLLFAIGCVMIFESIADGSAYGPHLEGTNVEAEVVGIRRVEGLLPRYEIELNWADGEGTPRAGITRVYRAQAERLVPGDPVTAVTAAEDPGRIVLREILDRKRLFRVGSAWVSPLAFVGALVAFVGVLAAALRNRLLGSPD